MTTVADMSLTSAQRERCSARCQQIREASAQHGCGAMLITNEVDVRFLTGGFGHDTMALVLPDAAMLVSDRRYEEYLAPWQDGVFDVAIANRPGQLEAIASALRDAGVDTLAIQGDQVSVSRQRQLAEAIGGPAVHAVSGVLASLRQCKTEAEIATIERAIEIQSHALHAALDWLHEGCTERQLAARLIYEMRCAGAEAEAFEPIVSTGANSSVIHHVPGDAQIGPGVLLIDWGARVDGLCSDLTRCFFLGEPDDELGQIYSIIARAEQAAINACRPGVAGQDVDAAARAVIDDAGYGDAFAHGVGHGIGLDVHELPFMGRAGSEAVLEPGMIVTIEPGIYLPGRGGIRIEDDVLVTGDGPRVLSADLDATFDGALRPWPPRSCDA